MTHVRTAVRRLLRTPVFTLTAVVTLAVGIGANTAIFSVVDAVLIEPLPYENADELVGLWHEAPGLGFDLLNQSPATYLTYRSDSRLLTDVALWDLSAVQVTGLDEPQQVSAMRVSANFLSLIGVSPVLGRDFSEEDDRFEAPRTVVVSHGFWRETLGGDSSAPGRSLTLNGTPATVIGVLPESFEFLDNRPDVLFTPRFDPSRVFVGNFSYEAIGRVAPGADMAAVAAELNGLIPVSVERYPGPISLEMLQQAGFANIIRPLKEDMVGEVRSVLWILLGTVGMVLLVACANVANLFLVRAEAQVRRTALQKALGADRLTIARELLTETVTLGLAGGAAGVAVAWLSLGALRRLAPAELPRIEAIGLDPSVLAFAAGISLLAGLLFGVVPLLKYGDPDLSGALKEGGRGGAGRERHRARSILVTAQVATAMVLLIGSGLMIRSFHSLRQVDPGFTRPEQLISFRATIPEGVIQDPLAVVAAHEQILSNLRAIPGVHAAGAVSSVTMDGFDNNDAVFVEDAPTPEGQIPPVRRIKAILPGYFGTMGNPVLAGRDLEWPDIHEGRPVVVVTENLAREYWQTPSAAIGRRIARYTQDGSISWSEIVGVVGNIRDDGMDQDPVATTFWPQLTHMPTPGNPAVMEPSAQRSMAFVVRAPEAVLATILPRLQESVWSVSASVPLASVATQSERIRRSVARTSFTLVLLAIAGGVGLLLGAVGLYGVISYSVSQRRREIGVRMALGAAGGEVAGMVLRQGMLLAGVGILTGLIAAAGATRLMSSLLYGVAPVDVPTFAAVPFILLAVAAFASWLPARRAAAVNPSVTLREE